MPNRATLSMTMLALACMTLVVAARPGSVNAAASPASQAASANLQPKTVATLANGDFEVEKTGRHGQGTTVVVDDLQAAKGSNHVFLKLHPGVFEPGQRYRVHLKYTIEDQPGAPADYMYVVVKSFKNGGKWYPPIWLQGDKGSPNEGGNQFLIPSDGRKYIVAVGYRGPIKVAIESATVQQLPRYADVPPQAADISDLPTPPTPKGPYEPYGMCIHADRLWQYTDEMVEKAVPMLAKAGVQWVRIGMIWGAFEPTKDGGWDKTQIARMDRLLALCDKYGIHAYAIIDGNPKWASSNPDNKRYWAFMPKDLDRFRAFVKFAAKRYGKQIDYWEIGNEPNWAYWQSGIPAYMKWARTAADEIRKDDPGALIINGGLANAGIKGIRLGANMPNPAALREMAKHGLADVFDIMAVHLYADRPEGMIYGLNRIYAKMCKLGLGHMPIWITETGFSTVGERTPEQQAQWIKQTYDLLLKHPCVEKVFYYNFRQKARDPKDTNREAGFGVVTPDLEPRPAYDAYRDMPKRGKPVRDPALLAVDRWSYPK